MRVLRLGKEGFPLGFGFSMLSALKAEVRECDMRFFMQKGLKAEVREYDMRFLRQKSENMI